MAGDDQRCVSAGGVWTYSTSHTEVGGQRVMLNGTTGAIRLIGGGLICRSDARCRVLHTLTRSGHHRPPRAAQGHQEARSAPRSPYVERHERVARRGCLASVGRSHRRPSAIGRRGSTARSRRDPTVVASKTNCGSDSAIRMQRRLAEIVAPQITEEKDCIALERLVALDPRSLGLGREIDRERPCFADRDHRIAQALRGTWHDAHPISSKSARPRAHSSRKIVDVGANKPSAAASRSSSRSCGRMIGTACAARKAVSASSAA